LGSAAPSSDYLVHDRSGGIVNLVNDRIYSPCAGFPTADEVENMDFIRNFDGIARAEQNKANCDLCIRPMKTDNP
jgi:hypothetical protein